MGTPAQWVDVMVSTVSSETWVVGTGGCDNSELDSLDVEQLWHESLPRGGSTGPESEAF